MRTVWLIQALVISHIAYVTALHKWYTAQSNNINALIRKVYKLALGVPEYASTELLLELGVHNALEEIAEAQRVSQLERMSATKMDRNILVKLGITYHVQHGEKCDIPTHMHSKIITNSLPRYMNLTTNAEFRRHRAKALLKTYQVSSWLKVNFPSTSPKIISKTGDRLAQIKNLFFSLSCWATQNASSNLFRHDICKACIVEVASLSY